MKTKKEKKVAVEVTVPEENNEAAEVVTEKPEKPTKEEPKAKITKDEKVKVESRPGMLRRKVIELGKKATIEKLLNDTELMEKYLQHKNWVTNDFAKLQERMTK